MASFDFEQNAMEYIPRATSKMDIPDSSIVRKSKTGRASLFGNDSSFAFTAIQSPTSITRSGNQSVFHCHDTCGIDYTRASSLCCWNCCHPFAPALPVPLPRSYDMKEKKFVVEGIFCSLACSKAFLMQERSFDLSQRVALFARMCSDVYGRHRVREAPSRYCLKMFGGAVDIQAFRDSENMLYELHAAPFISNYMVVEERANRPNTNVMDNWRKNIRGLRRPSQPIAISQKPVAPSMYDKHLQTASGQPESSGCTMDCSPVEKQATTADCAERSGEGTSQAGGGLLRFMM
jgi:hypothetical protein